MSPDLTEPTPATELAREQAYFNVAARHRDQKLADLAALPEAGAHPAAAAHLKRHADAVAAAVGGAGSAVAFGRIDDETGEKTYIGRHLIRDGASEVLVVNWQAPAAAPYFEASHDDPRGLTRKRTFSCEGNRIRYFTDVLFGQTGAGVDEFLLRELSRARSGVMRDIVATIQAAQYDIIRAPLDRVLVIEGGPGTGKSAVALHRVSWLRYRYRERLGDDVLVVGPHPTFIRYVGEVLPGLGDHDVELRDIGQLAPRVRRGRAEPREVSRLKGEARMADLLRRALAARVGVPEPAERLLLDGRFVTLPGAEVAEVVAACQAADLPYAGRRRLLRERLTQLVRDRTGTGPANDDAVANLVERLWPQLSAPAFLRDLFASRPRLRAAAGDDFTAEEVELLRRRGADRISEETWSAADLPLLDEVEHLLNGPGRRYAHIVVDEAQDLSPMQLRSVARRSATGSLTLVGDLAQSTGLWARDTWDEVTAHLPATYPVQVASLRYGYRVPRQVYALAAKLLPVAAPGVPAPEVVRDGPAEPRVHRVALAERADRAVAVAADYAAEGEFVGIVCPERCRREVEAALAANGLAWSSAERGELGSAINLVAPREAKGLEFDAVVVVEPEQIVAEDERGHRMLYTALTRTTKRLDIVCAGEPLPLAVPAVPAPRTPAEEESGRRFSDQDVARLAEYLAGHVRAAAPPQRWRDVLDQVAELLDGA